MQPFASLPITPCTLRSLVRALAALLTLCAGAAGAQSLEGVLMPGAVIEGHAKYESDCRKCHIPFNRAAQDGLCLDCHKEVAADVRQKGGFHGRLKPQPCRTCHTEHKGRTVNIAPLDERSFDHRQTDFVLRGAHAAPKVKCQSCHVAKKKHREAPGQCDGCHRKDDVHKGSLGAACADCHTDNNWKEARFDHDKTHFPLRGKHAPAKCESCHKNNRFKETPTACNACHAKDDKHKGRFGEKCETCHVDRDWTTLRFDHDTDTRYPLRGRHRGLKCETCHAGHLYRDKLQTACIACHRKNDKHEGTLGTACGDCHTERNWKEARFDHGKTRFPLRGKHDTIDCKACHKTAVFRDAPTACVACHRKDDKHKGTLGEACGDCHTERNWKESKFDHARTRFPLLGKHVTTKCEECHRDPDFKRTPSECFACHKKDDAHEGQEGERCGDCHGAETWKKAKFDHGRARFPLTGKHLVVECKKCHATPRYKDAKSECIACHDGDDARTHKRRLGPDCASCHNARDWKIWDFNHDRKTRFLLDGAHAKLACYACHKLPVEKNASLSMTCVNCHASDDVHEGTYGRQCERCHVSASFRQIRQRMGAHDMRGELAWLCAILPGAGGRTCAGALGRGASDSRGLP